jgi:hypothetical protein
MENQTPVNIPVNPPQAGWKPTNSTLLAVAAGAVAQFIASGLRAAHVWDMDAETQGSLTVIVMVLANYFHPDGGRK